MKHGAEGFLSILSEVLMYLQTLSNPGLNETLWVVRGGNHLNQGGNDRILQESDVENPWGTGESQTGELEH